MKGVPDMEFISGTVFGRAVAGVVLLLKTFRVRDRDLQGQPALLWIGVCADIRTAEDFRRQRGDCSRFADAVPDSSVVPEHAVNAPMPISAPVVSTRKRRPVLALILRAIDHGSAPAASV
ncbi:hypothetical protein [Tardiphaga sp.]|uniref:hypothetical protein n=1 Tax=Tardiphaga sp. TaxID=1926292 RepID=UPI0037D9A4E1